MGNKIKCCDIDLIPAAENLDDVENITDAYTLKKLIDGKDYDYIILDCPPAKSDITLLAMFAADYIVVPADSGSDALNGYSQLLSFVNELRDVNHNIVVLGIILNNFATQEALAKYMESEIKSGFPDGTVFDTVIHRTSLAAQCRYFGEPACIRDEHHRYSGEIKSVTDEIIKRINASEGGDS